MLDWGDLRFLLAVARTGAHAAAARMLGVDATTVGRRIAQLEASLESRVLVRTPAGWRPTEIGADLVRRAQRIEAEVAEAEVAADGADRRARGLVRVSGGDGILHFLVAPAVPGLVERHPEVVVELRPETRVVDLARREAEVAVRLMAETSPATVSRRVAPLAMGVYAGRVYVARRGAPTTLRELAAAPWVNYDAEMARAPQNRWLRRTMGDTRVAFRATTTTGLAAACAAGVGLAILPVRVAETDARLVRVVPRRGPPPREAYVVYREDQRRRAAVRAVAEWLVRLLACFLLASCAGSQHRRVATSTCAPSLLDICGNRAARSFRKIREKRSDEGGAEGSRTLGL